MSAILWISNSRYLKLIVLNMCLVQFVLKYGIILHMRKTYIVSKVYNDLSGCGSLKLTISDAREMHLHQAR